MIKRKQKAIAIVAHPDDETIWMGGYILAHPEFDWTIFSLCRASDADRAPKYAAVVKRYKAKGIIADMEDEGETTLKEAIAEARYIIKEEIAGAKFDLLFTHDVSGEYGHYLHKAVHQAVVASLNEKVIKAGKVYFFNYQKSAKGKVPSMKMKSDSDLICELTDEEFASKKSVMSDIYGFSPNGIDTGFCTNPESFKALNT